MFLRGCGMLLGGLMFITAAVAQNQPKIDPARGEQISGQVCAACHGPGGNSPMAPNPILAGQHSEYIAKQLANFKPHDGKPAERPNAIMMGMAANLSEDDMKALGAYFESQKPRARAARDPELVKLGQSIYRGGIVSKNVAACGACHGPAGAGIPAQFPRVAGQFVEYTTAQLKAFRSGERANDPNRVMRMVAGKLSDQEIAAVAEYISGLR